MRPKNNRNRIKTAWELEEENRKKLMTHTKEFMKHEHEHIDELAFQARRTRSTGHIGD